MPKKKKMTKKAMEKFLKDNFEKLTNAEMAEETGFPITEIQKILKKLNLSEKIESKGALPGRSRKVQSLSISNEREKESELYAKAIKEYEKALQYIRKKDFKKAKPILEKINDSVRSEMELNDRISMYLKVCDRYLTGNTSVSLKTFDDYYYDGIIKCGNNKFDDALESLNSALKKAGNNNEKGKALFVLAGIYSMLENSEKAIETLTKATTYDSSYWYQACNDSDFTNIAETEEFQNIISE